MTKKNIFRLLAVVLVIALAIIATVPFNVVSGKDGLCWMDGLSDDTSISDLTIPGTHDSGAVHSIADVSGACQSVGIAEQLKMGVRFFDIRLQQVEDELYVVHSFVDQATRFDTVVSELANFVWSYPSEFLIISIKEDNDAVNRTIPFADAVKNALDRCYDAMDYSSELPDTLGEARGKIFLMSRFNAEYGIPMHFGWQDSTAFELGEYYVQDYYRAESIHTKISYIEDMARLSEIRLHKLVLNFTSCYLDEVAFPPTYAAIPAMEINPWLYDFAVAGNTPMGVVIADFMTEELARALYRRNFK